VIQRLIWSFPINIWESYSALTILNDFSLML
jgi:hypothetical protein